MLAPTAAMAAEPKVPQWYEVATGVLAIPVALVGLAYSYLLIKKTRLESRKTELEIIEKEHGLKVARELPPVSTVLELRSSENKLLLLLVVRFVVLYLALQSWGLIDDAFEVMGFLAGTQKVFAVGLDSWALLALVFLEKLTKILYWIIFFALGWPLFKDANAALGLDVREYLRVSRNNAKIADTACNENLEGEGNDG